MYIFLFNFACYFYKQVAKMVFFHSISPPSMVIGSKLPNVGYSFLMKLATIKLPAC